jgi:hypothetical protein
VQVAHWFGCRRAPGDQWAADCQGTARTKEAVFGLLPWEGMRGSRQRLLTKVMPAPLVQGVESARIWQQLVSSPEGETADADTDPVTPSSSPVDGTTT